MGLIGGIGRIILIVLNLLILLVSLALTAIGVILKFFAKDIVKYLGPVDNLVSNTGIKSKLGIDLDLSSLADFPLLSEVGVALIAFGCVLLVLSFCACCGACYKLRPLLLIYIIIMAVLVITQATIGGLFLVKDSALHKTVKGKLSDQMHDKYDSNKSGDVFTLAIDLMNLMLDCCGISGLSDFLGGMPKSCCKSSVINSNIAQCLTSSPTAFNTEGCYDKLQDEVLKVKLKAAIILSVILLLQVVLIVFAFLVFKEQNSVGPI